MSGLSDPSHPSNPVPILNRHPTHPSVPSLSKWFVERVMEVSGSGPYVKDSPRVKP